MQRAVSPIVAALLFVALLPLFIVIGVAVKCGSPGPAIFRQTRIGYRDRPFTIFKFRTMVHGSGKSGVIVLPGDTRVTRVGRWLRATHLDELPQLWNIVRGEMRFIGPRPHPSTSVLVYRVKFPRYAERFQFYPGLTGPEQIRGRQWSLEHPEEAIECSIQYGNQENIWLDVHILLQTLRIILARQGV